MIITGFDTAPRTAANNTFISTSGAYPFYFFVGSAAPATISDWHQANSVQIQAGAEYFLGTNLSQMALAVSEY